MKTWTDEEVVELKRLLAENRSGGYIADALGKTRGSVIGKAHRLGYRLTGRPRGHPAPKRELRPTVIKPKGHKDPSLPPEPARPHEMVGCSLLDLTPRSCRWPIGDPKDRDFHFCGNTTVADGVPYCGYHTGIAHTSRAQLLNSGANTGFNYYGTKS